MLIVKPIEFYWLLVTHWNRTGKQQKRVVVYLHLTEAEKKIKHQKIVRGSSSGHLPCFHLLMSIVTLPLSQPSLQLKSSDGICHQLVQRCRCWLRWFVLVDQTIIRKNKKETENFKLTSNKSKYNDDNSLKKKTKIVEQLDTEHHRMNESNQIKTDNNQYNDSGNF